MGPRRGGACSPGRVYIALFNISFCWAPSCLSGCLRPAGLSQRSFCLQEGYCSRLLADGGQSAASPPAPREGSALPRDPFPSLTLHARKSATDVGTAGCRGGEWVRVGAAVGLRAQRPGGVPQPMGWPQTPSKVASTPLPVSAPIRGAAEDAKHVRDEPPGALPSCATGVRGCSHPSRLIWGPQGGAVSLGGGDTTPSLGQAGTRSISTVTTAGSRLCAERGRLRVPTTACVPIPAPWGPSPAGAEGCPDLGGGSTGGCRGAGADPAAAEPLAVSCLLAVPRSLGPASVCGAGDGVGPKSILSYRVSFLSCK